MDIDPNPTTGEVLRYLRRRTGQLADKIHEYRHLYHQNSIPFCKKNADAFFALDRGTRLPCSRIARSKYGWEHKVILQLRLILVNYLIINYN